MRLSFSLRFVVVALAWVAVAWFVISTLTAGRHVVGLILLAITFAAMARPGIDRLAGRLPRGIAIAAVFLLATISTVVLFVLQTRDLSQQTEHLTDAVGNRIDELEQSSLRSFLVEADVAGRLRALLDGLPTQVLTGTDDGVAAAQQGFELLLVVFLAIYAVQSGTRLLQATTRPLPERHRAEVADVIRSSAMRAARYLDRTIAAAIAGGVLAAGVATVLDLPGVVVLAVWVGAWSVVPMAGALVGYAPIVLLASADGSSHLAIAAVAGLVWLVADAALQRWSTHDTVRPGPLLATIALVFGIQLGWLVGIVISLFVVAVGAAAMDEMAARERPVSEPPPIADRERSATTTTNGSLSLDRISARSATTAVLVVVGIAVAVDLLRQAAPAPTRVVLGVALAVALHQLVDLATKHLGLARRWSAWLVTVVTFLAIAGFLVLALPSIIRQTVDLTADLPQAIEDLGDLPLVGAHLDSSGLLDRLDDAVSALPDRLAAEDSPLERFAISTGEALNAAFWILLVAAAAVNDGPRLVRSMVALVPERRRDRVGDVLGIVYRTMGRYAAGSAFVALLAGTFIFVASLVLGVPLAALCAVWAAIWNFVPQLGGYVGGAPFILFALAQGGTTGLTAIVAYVIYWQVENRLIQPVVISKAVDVSPFVAMSVVLLGAAVAGVAGALLATPLVGAAKVIDKELRGTADAASDRVDDAQEAIA